MTMHARVSRVSLRVLCVAFVAVAAARCGEADCVETVKCPALAGVTYQHCEGGSHRFSDPTVQAFSALQAIDLCFCNEVACQDGTTGTMCMEPRSNSFARATHE